MKPNTSPSTRAGLSFFRSAPADQLDQVAAAALDLIQHLDAFTAQVEKLWPTALLQPPEQIATLCYAADALETDAETLRAAAQVLRKKQPVGTRGPRGAEWSPPLTPDSLLYFASIASNNDPTYEDQLQARQAKIAQRAATHDTLCGRQTAKGEPCRQRAVIRPDGAPPTSCSRHMTDQETTELTTLWQAVISHRDCAGCGAPHGHACRTDGEPLNPIDGDYPRQRSFNGLTIHDCRLAHT